MLDDDNLDTIAVVPSDPEVIKEDKPKAKPSAPLTAPTGLPSDTVVSMGALVYQSKARNSVSVRAVQTRLLELGHVGAGSDLPGWLSAGTLEALEEFKAEAKVKGDNPLSRGVVDALFKGLSVKVVD